MVWYGIAVLPALGGIPVVLDRVVRSAGKDLGDLSPLVAVDAVGAHEDVLFRLRPGFLLYGWIELIVPSEKFEKKTELAEQTGRAQISLTCNTCCCFSH